MIPDILWEKLVFDGVLRVVFCVAERENGGKFFIGVEWTIACFSRADFEHQAYERFQSGQRCLLEGYSAFVGRGISFPGLET